jgi:hypothetical protein
MAGLGPVRKAWVEWTGTGRCGAVGTGPERFDDRGCGGLVWPVGSSVPARLRRPGFRTGEPRDVGPGGMSRAGLWRF